MSEETTDEVTPDAQPEVTDEETTETDAPEPDEGADAEAEAIAALIEYTSNDGTGPLYDYVAPTGSSFEYPDGSVPEVDEDGNPILEDRSADFPEEAAIATEIVGEPVDEPEGPETSTTTDETPEAATEASEGTEAPAEEANTDEGYDPTAHTVADVQEYLAANPDQADYVLDRERAGKARTTLIGA